MRTDQRVRDDLEFLLRRVRVTFYDNKPIYTERQFVEEQIRLLRWFLDDCPKNIKHTSAIPTVCSCLGCQKRG